jgi:SAM-dependent methyltransferase
MDMMQVSLSPSDRIGALLDVVRCPTCQRELSERYACEGGHVFETLDGVPVLVPGFDNAAASISDSFGREWSYFRHGIDRTWSQTVVERREDFLRHVHLSAKDLKGKRILDAGCGNGMLSAAIGELGGQVFACDLSPSVHHAARYFRESPVMYFQANLMQHPFRPGAFDIVYCAGVLHHTPDTHASFDAIAESVAVGGRFFVWLYHKMPEPKQKVRTRLRAGVARLPEPVRHGVAVGFAAKKQAQGVLSRNKDLNWQETLIATHDFWTPRYRWEHTQEELASWFKASGFSDVRVTEVGVNGFGAVATRLAAG